MQQGAAVVVVSDKLARTLAEQKLPGGRVGERLTLQGVGREVIGVLAEQRDRFLVALVPFADAERSLAPPSSPRTPDLIVRAARAEEVATVKEMVDVWVRRHAEWKDAVSVDRVGPRAAQGQCGRAS